VAAKASPDNLMARFEAHLARSSSECARVLGVSASAYANYARSDDAIPEAMQNHIDVIFRLPLDCLHILVRERLNGR